MDNLEDVDNVEDVDDVDNIDYIDNIDNIDVDDSNFNNNKLNVVGTKVEWHVIYAMPCAKSNAINAIK